MKNFLLIITTIFILIWAINSFSSSNIRKKNSISGIDKTSIEPPIQEKANYNDEIITINDKDITIKKLYSYKITGRVAKTYEYKEYYVR